MTAVVPAAAQALYLSTSSTQLAPGRPLQRRSFFNAAGASCRKRSGIEKRTAAHHQRKAHLTCASGGEKGEGIFASREQVLLCLSRA